MTKSEYLALVAKAAEAADAYYLNDEPIMSDYEYDDMMQGIKQFEKDNPDEISPDSPTQRVAKSVFKSSFEKVEHKVPMLSLLDVFNEKDVEDFVNAHPHQIFSVEHKIDGLSMSATYENGRLVRAETRGDGYIGEDITENAKFIKGLPHKLTGVVPTLLEVRCEVYLPVDRFIAINKEKEQNGEKLFANPRNAAAGLLRTKDINDMKDAGLECFVFNVQRCEGVWSQEKSHLAQLHILRNAGFQTVTAYVADCIPAVLDVIRKIDQDDRPNINYWIDGAVVKCDNLEVREEEGATGKYPRWAVAYKYPPEEKETEILDIVLQVGRTGRITPVAVLDPVFLAGTRVGKATLNNQRYITDMGLGIGATVVVRKAAEIIPQIVKVKAKGPYGVYDIAKHICPCCGEPITVDNNGMTCECRNPNCAAQFSGHVEFWASRDCMDIRGMGPAVIEKLIDNELIKEIPDIYTLEDVDDVLNDLLGPGITKNLLRAIEESKDRDIDRLIKALGIPGVGRAIGKEIAKRYSNIFDAFGYDLTNGKDAGRAAKLAELSAIDGVGAVSAEAIMSYFDKNDNWAMLFELRRLGVNTISKSYKAAAPADTDSAISGKTFVITGTLSQTREYFVELIESHGGKVSGSVSKKTDYLLCGEAAGSKLTKAQALGVPVLNEDQFVKMLSE